MSVTSLKHEKHYKNFPHAGNIMKMLYIPHQQYIIWLWCKVMIINLFFVFHRTLYTTKGLHTTTAAAKASLHPKKNHWKLGSYIILWYTSAQDVCVLLQRWWHPRALKKNKINAKSLLKVFWFRLKPVFWSTYLYDTQNREEDLRCSLVYVLEQKQTKALVFHEITCSGSCRFDLMPAKII